HHSSPTPKKKVNLEEVLVQLTANTTQFMAKTRTNFQNQASSIHNLEVQMGQIAKLLLGRPQGTLSSNTEINPKEQVKAVTLRSGNQLQDAPSKIEQSKNEEDD
ncbi:hypothetical protein CFOL_v3_21476, partial [Cephalotus follicularis]